MQVMSRKKLAPQIFPLHYNGNCVVKIKTIVARRGIEITMLGYNDYIVIFASCWK